MTHAEALAVLAEFEAGRYLRYADLTRLLEACAAACPDLCRLEAIGQSPEGRSIWAATLTNTDTGPADRKPGYLVDANTHAGEVTGGAAALHALHWLLTHYGVDPLATELLDTRAVYVVPRIAVDGVEAYLTTPHQLRSAPRRYPLPDDPPGFYAEDVDGDGRVLSMRQPHPDGDWKVDSHDPRLMVRRRPEDTDGRFYRLFTEGLIKDWDGRTVPPLQRPWRLDFNRNYPAFWNPEAKQPGAGRYPLSEPETRALAEFLVSYPNIGAYVAFHTTGQVLLRPPSYGPDDKMDQTDLEVFKRIGDLCTRITGAPCKSTFQAFNFPGQESLVKGADDWAYEHYGVQAYTFELWNPDLRSGGQGYAQIGVKGLLDRTPEQEAEAQRKLLTWQDQELNGTGFITWRPFTHPQLGEVEIGGWDFKFALQNPPEGPILAEVADQAARFLFEHALATPRLVAELKAEPLGAGLYKLSARIVNVGGLPTNVTDMAVQVKAARPIEVRLEGPVTVLAGQIRQEIGHLEGWAASGGRPASNEAWVDWVVRAEPGAAVLVTAHTARAGMAEAGLVL